MRRHDFYTYIMASNSGTLYVGMTNDLIRRVFEHKTGKCQMSFTSRYKVDKLVYYERFDTPIDAIAREKQIKHWRREKKEALIKIINPCWRDLSDGWYDDGKNSGEGRLH